MPSPPRGQVVNIPYLNIFLIPTAMRLLEFEYIKQRGIAGMFRSIVRLQSFLFHDTGISLGSEKVREGVSCQCPRGQAFPSNRTFVQ